MKHDDRLNITGIDSRGSDLEDLLANAEISVQDWNGNPVDFEAESLHSQDYDEMVRLFTEWLAGEPFVDDGWMPYQDRKLSALGKI